MAGLDCARAFIVWTLLQSRQLSPGMELRRTFNNATRSRFPASVPAGARVRAKAEIVSCDEVGGGWWQSVTRFTLEVEGSEKPCFVGDSVTRVMAPAE